MTGRARRRSQDIPSGQNFSPNEVDLPRLLELAHSIPGDRSALSEAIRREFYAERPIPSKGGTVWRNVTTGMTRYGILDESAVLTELGRELYELRDDEAALYRRLALHLLIHVNGSALIKCLIDMHRAGESPTLPTIREALEDREIHTSDAGKSISLLRGWLAKAGLFRSQWVPNSKLYYDMLGMTEAEIQALASLTEGQRCVLKMLASLGPGHHDSSQLRKATQRAYAIRLNEKQFPKDVLYKLQDLEYITLTRKGGRAWAFDVQTTPKLDDEVTVPLLEQFSGLDPRLAALLRLSPAEIVGALDGGTYEKGVALEALAFKLMRIVGLTYMATRHRPSAGRFEVDLLFDSDRLTYQRWQIQCKNTDCVSLDDVAKEVGLTYYLLSTVIVVVTRGTVGEDARRYSTEVMRRTNLAIALIDGADVTEVLAEPLAMFDILDREASFALQVKPLTDATPSSASSRRRCPGCGEAIPSSAKYCPACGHDVGLVTPAGLENGS